MTLVLRYAARSDRGLVRSNNEDSVYAGARLLALADGMGGHAAGEVASQLVVAALAHLDDDEPSEDLLGKLSEAIYKGNSAIAAYIAQHPEVDGMGTTLDAILFAGNRIGLAHIGDSRTYLLRQGELTQITKDDTFVQTLVDEGRLTPEEAHTHPQRSLIMRALTGHETTPTLTIRETQPGDRYLLCSDGLSDPVSNETIREALLISDVNDAALRLIELALRSGGPDNVTVIVADVVDIDYGQTRPIVAGALCDDEDHAIRINSAAGRASIITTQPKKITKRLLPQMDTAIHKPQLLLRRWLLRVCVIAVMIAAILIGFPLVGNSYYITAYHGNVTIMRGIQGSFLGIPLQRPHRLACLDDHNALSLITFTQKDQNSSCQILDLKDLKQAKREQIITGLPTGTFNDINTQLHNLAKDSILPLCAPLTPNNNSSLSTLENSRHLPISEPQIGIDCRTAT